MKIEPSEKRDPDRVIMDLYYRVVDLEEEVKLLKRKIADMEKNMPGMRPKLSKRYMNLSNYLKDSGKDEITLTFKDIEDILGFKLTKLQQTDPSSWANSDSHSLARSWLGSGYVVDKRDLSNGIITFKKNTYEN